MRNRFMAFLLLLLPVLCLAAVPNTMYMVDLRGISNQPELDTWLGSLQGTVNRQHGPATVFVVRNGADDDLANALVAMYHLQREVMTPGALLETVRPTLTGQVRYNPAQPWTRNIALTAAASAPGNVIATSEDLGLPTVLDLRNRWTDRCSAYAWELEQYGQLLDAGSLLLSPESGNLLADLIASRKLFATDLALTDTAETALLQRILQRLPVGGRLLGSPDDRAGEEDAALWQLMQWLKASDHTIIPMRVSVNLSCMANLPITRPLLQGRVEDASLDGPRSIILIYDGGSEALSGGQSLDYATNFLPEFLNDPALADLPVGIEVPLAIKEYAPALYQLLIARQRLTKAELIAAPNGDGWGLPMAMSDASSYLQRSAALGKAMDLTGISLLDFGDQTAYAQCLHALADTGWRGAFTHPIANEFLPDKTARVSSVLPSFTSLVGVSRVRSTAELRRILTASKQPFQVIYLDPFTMPPATVQNMLPEIKTEHFLLAPSQAFRAVTEYAAVVPWLQAKQQYTRKPKRGQPTLKVEHPTTTLTAPSAADAIPISVRITGNAPVLVARLVYRAPHDRTGAVDLQNTGNGVWTATVPPTLGGGPLEIRARVVEQGEFGISLSAPLTINIPVVDSDDDGVEDTLEEYRGSDPMNWDTDHDGLADGFDSNPMVPDHETAAYFPTIYPPADGGYLADAGTSSADADGRLLPAGSSVRYRIPLLGLPGATSALHIQSIGPGTVRINEAAADQLFGTDSAMLTTCQLSTEQMSGKELLVTLTAGEKPLRLLSLRLAGNPNGPYIQTPQFNPKAVPAGSTITASAVVYSPRKLQAVRLRYGNDPAHLTTIPMGRLEGTGDALFAVDLPAQSNGTLLVYGVEAEDVAGNVAASPFCVAPVGHPRQHTIVLQGTRDLQGSWNPMPIWGNIGRTLVDGTGEDTSYFRAHAVTYTVWLLAKPSERGINVNIKRRASLTAAARQLLDTTVPAGSVDGWYRLGTFNSETLYGVNIAISPTAGKGFCAYGELVLTQDSQFAPPVAHASFDWYNSLTITGLKNGQSVKGRIVLNVTTTGNIDAVSIAAKQKSTLNGMFSTQARPFVKQRDGSYQLDTRDLNPGDYELTASGLRITSDDGVMQPAPLINVTMRFTVPE